MGSLIMMGGIMQPLDSLHKIALVRPTSATVGETKKVVFWLSKEMVWNVYTDRL